MRFPVCIFLALSACASFPQLDGTISDAARNAPYPTLTPIPIAPAVSGVEEAAFEARIAALRARADRIRQIDLGTLQ